MKKILLAATLLTLTSVSFAATSDSVYIKGNVPKVVSIAALATGDAVNLDLTEDTTLLKIATITEKSNSAAGYTVTMSSDNAGKLKRAASSDVFAYTLSYDGSADLDLASGPVEVTNTSASSTNALSGVSKDLKISYTGVPSVDMVSGDYEDTIRLLIVFN